MSKLINEKTFELNITNELLNISKSFIWYLDQSPISHLLPRHVWDSFMRQTMFYAVGLTQDEEASPGGGYDVSIDLNCNAPFDQRLLLLQFKSGIHRKRCQSVQSLFHHSHNPQPHIQFVFNDAADKTQHIILRDLANKPEIQSESVLYVFPRVTSKADLRNKIGNLIWDSSFVPVLDMDRQAANQNPSISITPGITHNFRTTYDGRASEINFYFYPYNYDPSLLSDLLLELVRIQIERFARVLLSFDKTYLNFIFEFSIERIQQFVATEIKNLANNYLSAHIFSFVQEMAQNFKTKERLLSAPSKYTTIIPKDGLTLTMAEKLDYSNISYQVF